MSFSKIGGCKSVRSTLLRPEICTWLVFCVQTAVTGWRIPNRPRPVCVCICLSVCLSVCVCVCVTKHLRVHSLNGRTDRAQIFRNGRPIRRNDDRMVPSSLSQGCSAARASEGGKVQKHSVKPTGQTTQTSHASFGEKLRPVSACDPLYVSFRCCA